MKLIPVSAVIRRLNEIDFALDERRFDDAARLTKELSSGLEFFEEVAPQTLAPGRGGRRAKVRTRSKPKARA